MTPLDLLLYLLAVAASLPFLGIAGIVTSLLVLAAFGWARRGAPTPPVSGSRPEEGKR